jgi:hypothetical protein
MPTPRNPTPEVSGRYGAPMGRADHGISDGEPVKLSLRHIRLNGGGYDAGGAYWGLGPRLYWAGSDDGFVDRFFRARNREAAKAHLRLEFPDAKFYR